MDQATAAKIRTHRWGRRRLASDSAWNLMNRHLDDEKYAAFRTAVTGNDHITLIIAAINDAFTAALVAQGFPAPANNEYFSFTDAKPFIPRSIWFGYITLPTGSLTAQKRTDFQLAESHFADQCGLFRAALARFYDIHKVINDVGNSPEQPNPGGVVGPDGRP